jgi:hypothetical protein
MQHVYKRIYACVFTCIKTNVFTPLRQQSRKFATSILLIPRSCVHTQVLATYLTSNARSTTAHAHHTNTPQQLNQSYPRPCAPRT